MELHRGSHIYVGGGGGLLNLTDTHYFYLSDGLRGDATILKK
jgi:hypothetical protein